MMKHLVLAGAAALLVATTAHAQSTAPAAAPAPSTHAAATTPANHDTVKHDSKADITMAQQQLTKDGLYKGKINGEWNNDLGAAIKKYQTQNKLKVTGKLDEETINKLKPAMPAAAPAQ